MKPKLIFQVILTILALMGCEKESDRDIRPVPSDLLVVDATITNEAKRQVISLSTPIYKTGDLLIPASGAKVSINDGDSIHVFNETPAGSGKYLTNSPFPAVTGKIYTLQIQYREKT